MVRYVNEPKIKLLNNNIGNTLSAFFPSNYDTGQVTEMAKVFAMRLGHMCYYHIYLCRYTYLLYVFAVQMFTSDSSL